MASGEKPVLIPAFGAWLQKLRGTRSRATVARLARDRFGVDFDESTLANYEAGRVLAPDPGTLWALAHIYEASIDAIIARLLENRANRSATTLASPTRTVLDVGPDEEDAVRALRRLSPKDRENVVGLLIRLAGSTTPPEYFRGGEYVGPERRRAS